MENSFAKKQTAGNHIKLIVIDEFIKKQKYGEVNK